MPASIHERARPRWLDLRVRVTASTEEVDLVRSHQNGVDSYLGKPVDFDEFRDMVKRIGFNGLVVNQTPAGATSAHEGRA